LVLDSHNPAIAAKSKPIVNWFFEVFLFLSDIICSWMSNKAK
jgi:hypothetical protein